MLLSFIFTYSIIILFLHKYDFTLQKTGIRLYPPLRSKFTKSNYFLCFKIHQYFNFLITIGHKLNHQFPTSTAWNTGFPIWHDCKDFFISCSPFVIILKIAFLSAHIPNVEQVSTQTPTYIFSDDDSIAAATPPASTVCSRKLEPLVL